MTRHRVGMSAAQELLEARMKSPVISTCCRACGAPVPQITLSAQHAGGSITTYPPLCDACNVGLRHGHVNSICDVCRCLPSCREMIGSRRAVLCEWPSLAEVMR